MNGYWVLHVGEKDTLQGYLNEIEMKRELSKHNIERKLYKRMKIADLSLEVNILYRVANNVYGE